MHTHTHTIARYPHLRFMIYFQEMPIILSGNDEQKKKYLTRMIEEPLMSVRFFFML